MRRSRVLVPLTLFAIVVGMGVAVALDLQYHWTAYSSFTGPVSPLTQEQTIERQKTLWDWLDLLLVPSILAAGGLWFSRGERRNEQAIAAQRAEEAALEAYLAQMTDLLLDKELSNAPPEDPARAVARAWTLTALRRVTGDRKGVILRFLFESNLIDKENNIVTLVDSDLRGTDLGGANLRGAYLEGADLEGANLGGANLERANLRGANLKRADLRRANLKRADLRRANLKRADLREAFLESANLWEAFLESANLRGANLERAYLARADLLEADLRGASMRGVHLEGAYLARAYLNVVALTNVRYDDDTRWPQFFDPIAAGAVHVVKTKETDQP